MKILFATFQSREEFLERLQGGGKGVDGAGAAADEGASPAVGDERSVLTIETKAEYDDCEEMILEIGFPGLPNRILVRAEALGPDGAGGQQFRILADDADKRDFLVAVADGTATASWKRKHRRFPIRLPARFVVEGQEESVPLRGDAEIEDLGSGGVALKTARSLPDGARVTIVLDPLDGSPEIEFDGHVVWNRQDESGIQYDTLGGEDMKRLRRLIREVKLSGETVE